MPDSPDLAGNAVGLGITFEVQQLLDAMDGVAYMASMDGIIQAVGRTGWDASVGSHARNVPNPDSLVGRNLFSMMGGTAIRDAYRGMHQKLSQKVNSCLKFECRCDSPETERTMLVSMSPIGNGSGTNAILYQAQILHERYRVPISLFSPENYRTSTDNDRLVSLCSFCHDVAWPVGAHQPNREWIKPEAYYARGGATDMAVSHGICPTCFTTIVAPNIR